MISEEQVVFIVDDDQHVRELLCELLTPRGLRAHGFGSAAEYAAFPRPDLPGCLILDVELPDINGLEFQQQIADGDHPPIVFVTGHGDISSSVRAIKGGAIDFLTKPFRESELIKAINAAIDQDRISRLERSVLAELRRRLSRLTPREREVLPLVASGLLNKQAAAELGISEVTLQIHRCKIMQKMETASLPDLVRIAGKLGIPITHSRNAGIVSK
ncbi:response regulator transcription factor [Bradyrhizobium cenepequi]